MPISTSLPSGVSGPLQYPTGVPTSHAQQYPPYNGSQKQYIDGGTVVYHPNNMDIPAGKNPADWATGSLGAPADFSELSQYPKFSPDGPPRTPDETAFYKTLKNHLDIYAKTPAFKAATAASPDLFLSTGGIRRLLYDASSSLKSPINAERKRTMARAVERDILTTGQALDYQPWMNIDPKTPADYKKAVGSASTNDLRLMLRYPNDTVLSLIKVKSPEMYKQYQDWKATGASSRGARFPDTNAHDSFPSGSYSPHQFDSKPQANLGDMIKNLLIPQVEAASPDSMQTPIAQTKPTPVVPKEQIATMRKTMDDSALMHTVYNSDPAFKAKVDMMKPFYQQQAPDWQARFPTFALNKYYGINPDLPTDPGVNTMLSTVGDPQHNTPQFWQPFAQTKPSLPKEIAGSLLPSAFTQGMQNPIAAAGQDIQNRGNALHDTLRKSAEGSIGPVRAAGEAFNTLTGGVKDVLGEGLKAVSSVTIPDFIQKGIGLVAQDVGVPGAAQKTAEQYTQWKQAHPDAALALESIGNLGGATLAAYGTQELANQAVGAAKKIGKALVPQAKTGQNVAPVDFSKPNKGPDMVPPSLKDKQVQMNVPLEKIKFEDSPEPITLNPGDTTPPPILKYDPSTDTYTVIDGNHRLSTFKDMGYNSVPATVVDKSGRLAQRAAVGVGAQVDYSTMTKDQMEKAILRGENVPKSDIARHPDLWMKYSGVKPLTEAEQTALANSDTATAADANVFEASRVKALQDAGLKDNIVASQQTIDPYSQEGAKAIQEAQQRLQAARTPQNIQKLVQPKVTDSSVKDVIESNPSLVKKGGLFRKGELLPSASEKKLADTAGTIPGFGQNDDIISNAKVVHDSIGSESEQLRSALQKNNVVLPIKESNSTISNALEKASGDFGEQEGIFKSTGNIWKEVRSQHPGNIEGEWNARIAFDQRMENQFGAKIFEKGTARAVAVRAVREAANSLIDNYASKTGVSFTPQISRISSMYDILENLATKADSKTLHSTFSKILSSPLGKVAANATGVGAALHFLP